MHKMHKHPSHSAQQKPHGVATGKHFFGSKLIHNTQLKSGGRLDIFDHPLTSHPFLMTAQESGFQVGGV